MAHFLALVLVDSAEPAPAEAGERLMRPHFDPDAPEAKCDGFVIGGSFDGDLWGKQQHHNLTPVEFQARYGVVRAEDNVRPVAELRPAPEPLRRRHTRRPLARSDGQGGRPVGSGVRRTAGRASPPPGGGD